MGVGIIRAGAGGKSHGGKRPAHQAGGGFTGAGGIGKFLAISEDLKSMMRNLLRDIKAQGILIAALAGQHAMCSQMNRQAGRMYSLCLYEERCPVTFDIMYASYLWAEVTRWVGYICVYSTLYFLAKSMKAFIGRLHFVGVATVAVTELRLLFDLPVEDCGELERSSLSQSGLTLDREVLR
ncbi:hypothetical protein EYF80_007719 [Liparis tanakae]|uniref:Uncharacterized protein n=1 Tax=Liparis tanakae TaxID=230148 RepID=A0A4Z2IXU2_9TELE|nr:hypothetical protein EYF80_007719 [Liparis tanakae]